MNIIVKSPLLGPPLSCAKSCVEERVVDRSNALLTTYVYSPTGNTMKSLYIYKLVYEYIHIYIYIYTYTHMHRYSLCNYIYTYICMYIYIYIYDAPPAARPPWRAPPGQRRDPRRKERA